MKSDQQHLDNTYATLLNLIDNTQAFAGILSLDGTLLFSNATPLKAMNLTPDAVEGKKFWDCSWWSYDAQIQANIKKDYEAAAAGTIVNREVQFLSAEGLHWLEYNSVPVFNDAGEIINIVVEGRSIEERKQAEQALAVSRQEYKSFFEDLDEAFLLINKDTFVECNMAAVRLLGYTTREELKNKRPVELSPERQPDGRDSAEKANEIIALAYKNGSHRFEWILLRNDGSPIEIEVLLTPVQFDGTTLLHNVWRDLTDTRKQQKALEDSEIRYRSLFEKSADALIITEAGVYVDCNEAAFRMLGYDNKQEILGVCSADLSPVVQPDGRNSLEKGKEVGAVAFEKGSNRFEWYYKRKNGEVFPAEALITVIPYGERKLLHVVLRDITEIKRQQEALKQLAHYDSLTGLPNRVLFADRFKQATAHSKRNNTQLAVCFLDLDNFKPINDEFGHDTGDALLIEVARRISTSLREEDSVSRQGGDEFILLLGGVNSYQECEQLIGRILQDLSDPYIIDGYPHSVSASCGITIYPRDNGDIDLLVRHADHAMYQAKLEGKNTFAFFNADTERLSQQHMVFLQRVSQAIDNDELQLYYQPKIDMRSGDMFGAEALLRWHHPDDGLISPFGFLPKIENTQVMIDVGNWVIEQALVQLSQWCKEGKDWVISINIDAYHFMQQGFVEFLILALKKHPDVPAKQLEIEILETVAFEDIEQVSTTINVCQALGVSFALDDFGTGYSSLAYLKRLPVQWLKIDQNFVRDMLVDEQDLALIEGIISLSKAFKHDVIAEGVETVEHGSALLKLGCYYAQGYGIAKPMRAAELIPWQESYQADNSWTRYSKNQAC